MVFTTDDLIGECISKDMVAECIKDLVENGCDFQLVKCPEGYSLYAKGELPDYYKC